MKAILRKSSGSLKQNCRMRSLIFKFKNQCHIQMRNHLMKWLNHWAITCQALNSRPSKCSIFHLNQFDLYIVWSSWVVKHPYKRVTLLQIYSWQRCNYACYFIDPCGFNTLVHIPFSFTCIYFPMLIFPALSFCLHVWSFSVHWTYGSHFYLASIKKNQRSHLTIG